MIKLNLGCGNNLIKGDGWINIDKYDKEADVILDMADLQTVFQPNTVDEIVIYQALEHTPWHRLHHILSSCFDVMKIDATLIIEVPDMDVVARGILKEGITQKWQDNIYGGYHRPWDADRYPDAFFHAGSIHYQAFNFKKLDDGLKKAGFSKVIKQEMKDKHPDYHYEENLSVKAVK